MYITHTLACYRSFVLCVIYTRIVILDLGSSDDILIIKHFLRLIEKKESIIELLFNTTRSETLIPLFTTKIFGAKRFFLLTQRNAAYRDARGQFCTVKKNRCAINQ